MKGLREPKERDLYLTDQVDQKSISELMKQIIAINNDDAELAEIYVICGLAYIAKPIRLFIDCYGGNFYQGLGIVGVMECSKTQIHTIVTGCAMSMGFIILISGHKRFAHKYATPLYHTLSAGGRDNIQGLVEDIEECERLQSVLDSITVKKTSIGVDKLKHYRERKKDWYIIAEESLRLSVVDEII